MSLVLAMTDSDVLNVAVRSMVVTAKLAAPILIVSLAIGFGISLFQSVTQIQDATLTFVPKLAGVALVIVVAGHWMLAELATFTRQMFQMIPILLGH